jgi:hypothetical protein
VFNTKELLTQICKHSHLEKAAAPIGNRAADNLKVQEALRNVLQVEGLFTRSAFLSAVEIARDRVRRGPHNPLADLHDCTYEGLRVLGWDNGSQEVRITDLVRALCAPWEPEASTPYDPLAWLTGA